MVLEELNNQEKNMVVGETIELPTIGLFSEGVYLRTIFMPKGSIVIGKQHKTRHFNIALTGKAEVWINGEYKLIEAPTIFESLEDVRKVFYILEDMQWTTVHPTELKDEDEIEKEIIEEDSVEIQRYLSTLFKNKYEEIQ